MSGGGNKKIALTPTLAKTAYVALACHYIRIQFFKEKSMYTALIRDSLKFAFTKLFKYWWVAAPRLLVNALAIGIIIFTLCIAGVYGYGFFGSGVSEAKSILLIFSAPIILATIAIISVGIASTFTVAASTKIALDLYDHKKTPLFMFNQIGNGIIILCSAIIISIAGFFSLFLLIFPAIYFTFRWMFSAYAVVDLGKGPFGSLAHSWRCTRAIKRPLFWISIILVILAIVKLFILSKYGYLDTFNELLEKPKILLTNPNAIASQSLEQAKLIVDIVKSQKGIIVSAISLGSLILASLGHLFATSLYRKLSGTRQK